MDVSRGGDQHQQQQQQPHQHRPASALAKAVGVAHLCDHRCCVSHLFGNTFRCETSGQVHVCDSTCAQRVYNDRYSAICRVSRRVFPHAAVPPAPCRKRGCSQEEEGADAAAKRGPSAPPAARGDAGGAFFAVAGHHGSQDDAMVM